MFNYKNLKTYKRLLTAAICRLLIWLPDPIYLKIRFRLIMGYSLNLGKPQTFNEKINWLKIYDRNPLYPALVDKYSVKKYVAKKIGVEHVIPTYGVWNTFSEIDFDSLPNQFVLKSTNGGGGTGVIICRDKSELNKKVAKKILRMSMKTNGRIGREWPYQFIKPRIIAEKLLEPSKSDPHKELAENKCITSKEELIASKNNETSYLKDYKIFCFNGEPKLLFYPSDRYKRGESLKFDWYDVNLNHLPITSMGYQHSKERLQMFPQWEEMKNIARKLSQNIPFVRVDLYLVDSKVYFGELTFFHDAGFVPLKPIEWEKKIGNMINLPTPMFNN